MHRTTQHPTAKSTARKQLENHVKTFHKNLHPSSFKTMDNERLLRLSHPIYRYDHALALQQAGLITTELLQSFTPYKRIG